MEVRMTEGGYMTAKSLKRTEIFLKIKNKQITQTKAANELDLTLRHVQRLYSRFKKEGAKALASQKHGKRGNRQLPEIIVKRVSELITCDLYEGFRPLFMCETLKKRHDIKISKETTRQLMIANGVWHAKNKKSPVVHQQRPRRVRMGELVQIDGSPHNWFENRGERCTLIVFIDDATGRIHAKFFEAETTNAYMKTAWEYFRKYGKPCAFYSDKHGIFRINQPSCSRKDQLTQFGRAMRELDIQLLCASTPQAKGRVERMNATLQDRLVKELRLRNISSIDAANKFLQEEYLEEHNKRFSVKPQSREDAHRKIDEGVDLSEILCEKYTRKVSKNLELQFDSIIYQIKLDNPPRSLIRASVTVIRKLDGKIIVKHKGIALSVVECFKQPHNGDEVDSKEIERFLRIRKKIEIPKYHPWMQEGRAEIRRRVFAKI
jgi:transposase